MKNQSTNILFKPILPKMPRWVLALAGGMATLVFLFAVAVPNLLKSRQAANQSQVRESEFSRYAPSAANESPRGILEGKNTNATVLHESTPPSAPMIIRTAELTLVSKEFEKTRAEVEDIIRRHRGYSGQLNVTGQAGAGRSLAATYRIPSDQLDAALAELKALARVEQESQGGEEVTSQMVDLEARLSNARNTEQRLNQVLQQRAGKMSDVLEVEQEISRVRGEIETMEAEQKNLQNRVQYATLDLKLSEEYKAQIDIPSNSTGTLLHNAMVGGYRDAVDTVLGMIVFFLNYGPTLIVWGLILYFPAKLAWQQLKRHAH